MWFRVDEKAPDDERIKLVAARLGMTHGDAFLACCRVWRWLYRKGAGVMQPDEVDTVSGYSGFAHAMLECQLAEGTPEGLRIAGSKRAEKYAAFCALQRERSLLAVTARNEVEHTNGHPMGDPLGHPSVPIYILSGSESDPDPESGKSEVRAEVVARERQRLKHQEAEEAAERWMEWFNRRFTRSFRVTKEVTKAVRALLTAGYSEKPDMRAVALYLRSRWGEDEKMQQYLVPSSILRPTKFAERLDLAREWDPQLWQVQP